MGIYYDKTLDAFYIQFAYDRVNYKKRFPRGAPKEDMETFEATWRKDLSQSFNDFSKTMKDAELADIKNCLNKFHALVESRKSICKRGFIYVIRFLEYYKIGFTTNLSRRISDFTKVSLPVKPEMVLTINTDRPKLLEEVLHLRFESKRLNGEWFGLNGDDVNFLNRLSAHFQKYAVTKKDFRLPQNKVKKRRYKSIIQI